MPANWISAFIDALHALEDRREIEPLLHQFSPGASLWNISHSEPRRGPAEIRDFWEGYRRQFGQIHSHFERIIEEEDQAALEWRAEGTLGDGGSPVAYRGVTLLQRGGDGVTEFASYYDPRPFEAPLRAPRTPAARSTFPAAHAGGGEAHDEELDIEEEAPSVMSYG